MTSILKSSDLFIFTCDCDRFVWSLDLISNRFLFDEIRLRMEFDYTYRALFKRSFHRHLLSMRISVINDAVACVSVDHSFVNIFEILTLRRLKKKETEACVIDVQCTFTHVFNMHEYLRSKKMLIILKTVKQYMAYIQTVEIVRWLRADFPIVNPKWIQPMKL